MPRDPRPPGARASCAGSSTPLASFASPWDGPDDVRAFTCGFVVRGFDIDEGLAIDSTTTVESPQLGTEAMNTEGAG